MKITLTPHSHSHSHQYTAHSFMVSFTQHASFYSHIPQPVRHARTQNTIEKHTFLSSYGHNIHFFPLSQIDTRTHTTPASRFLSAFPTPQPRLTHTHGHGYQTLALASRHPHSRQQSGTLSVITCTLRRLSLYATACTNIISLTASIATITTNEHSMSLRRPNSSPLHEPTMQHHTPANSQTLLPY